MERGTNLLSRKALRREGSRPLGLGEVEATGRATPRPGPVGGSAAGTGWKPRGPSSRVRTGEGAGSGRGRAPFTWRLSSLRLRPPASPTEGQTLPLPAPSSRRLHLIPRPTCPLLGPRMSPPFPGSSGSFRKSLV